MKTFRSSILILVYLLVTTYDVEAQWTAVNGGLDITSVNAFAVSGSRLFAGTSVGVFLSTDNGTSWTSAGLTKTDVRALIVSGTNLFAGTDGSGVFHSTDYGTTLPPTGMSLHPGNVAIFDVVSLKVS